MTEHAGRIRYIALKLDDTSREKLVGLVKRCFQEYPQVYCDHVTLAYGQDQVEAYDQELFGEEVRLDVWNVVYDGRCAAAEVDPEQLLGLGANNERPHITLVTADGTPPVYSNELLEDFYEGRGDAGLMQLEEPVVLAGRVEPVYARPLAGGK